MKKKTTSGAAAAALAIMLALSTFIITGCGTAQGENLENYMKGHPTERSDIDTQLYIISPDAKGSVQYVGNTAEVTVQYYAMTEDEVKAIEPEKAEVRAKAIIAPYMEQFEKDTGNKAEFELEIIGHAAE